MQTAAVPNLWRRFEGICKLDFSSSATSAQLAASASVLVRLSPLPPTRCYPVASGFKPRDSVSILGPRAEFRVLYRRGTKVLGPPFQPSTSAQLAGSASVLVRVSPLTPTMCNPVALGFKPREPVSNVGPPGQISCFISNRNQSSGVRRSSPRPRPN